ncbi:MAG: F0F1 ATP synthase subunit A [Candidatus Cloacimonas sp.]|nr:F0F1 ATP synthase subunit A [Candidatus Cloacimonadota bacterium]
MTKKKIIWLFIIVMVIQVLLSFKLEYKINVGINPDTGKFGVWNTHHPTKIQDQVTEEFQPDLYLRNQGIEPTIYGSRKLYEFFQIFSKNGAINAFKLIRMILIIDIVFLAIILYMRRNMGSKPSKRQLVFEMVYGFIDDLTTETLGKQNAHFTPYILTIFLFILSANFIGIVPIPGFMEPTRNLNVPLGMGLVIISVVHYVSIKKSGFKDYLKGYAEPFFALAPINVIGEVSKVISISFRLFGNVLGGAIIMLVVSSLTKYVILPVGMNLFFGLFVGTIQAFVFTILAVSYIAVVIFD